MKSYKINKYDSKKMLPGVQGILFSALRSDGLSGFAVRSSKNSASGFVVVASFAARSHALAFSNAWAARLPRSIPGCAVRENDPGFFSVSVPVRQSSVPLAVFSGSDAYFDTSYMEWTEQLRRKIILLWHVEYPTRPLRAVPLAPGVCCRLGLCASRSRFCAPVVH